MVGMLGRIGLALRGVRLSDVGARKSEEERGFLSARDVGRKEACLIVCPATRLCESCCLSCPATANASAVSEWQRVVGYLRSEV